MNCRWTSKIGLTGFLIVSTSSLLKTGMKYSFKLSTPLWFHRSFISFFSLYTIKEPFIIYFNNLWRLNSAWLLAVITLVLYFLLPKCSFLCWLLLFFLFLSGLLLMFAIFLEHAFSSTIVWCPLATLIINSDSHVK